MASIAQVTVRFGVDLKDFTTKMQKATKEIQALGRQMQSTGRNLTRNITLPIAGLGVAATKLAIDFDESMTKIQTLVGISADTVEDFKGKVLALSGQTAQAPAALADALFTVTSAGLRGAEALEVLKMAAKGSAVGMGDTKEIARAVTAVMQAYGPEVMSAAQAMDVLTATVREGNLEASELAPVLGRVVGLASQMGISFDEVGASIATFTRLGVDSAEAVTGLRGFLSGIIKPTKEGRDALAKMGLTFADLRNEIAQNGLAKTMFELVQAFDGNIEALSAVIPNVRALGAVMGTAGAQGEQYLKIQDSIANSTGILNQAFEDTTKSGAFKLKEAFASLKQVGTDIGGVVLPVVADLAKNVKSLFERFAQLSQNTKENIVKFAAMAAAIGPVIYAVGTLITSFGGLLKTLRTLSLFIAANPWFALAGAVGAVVAALVGYSAISSKVESSQQSRTQKVNEEKDSLNQLVQTITRLNEGNETRTALIDELKTNYPDFISKLGNEELTNKNLKKALEAVNLEYTKKIALAAAEDELTENLRKQKQIKDKLVENEKEITRLKLEQAKADTLQRQQDLLSQISGLGVANEINTNQLVQLREEYKLTVESYNELVQAIGGTSVESSGSTTPNEGFGGTESLEEQLVLLDKLQQKVDEVTGTFAGFEGINSSGISSSISEMEALQQVLTDTLIMMGPEHPEYGAMLEAWAKLDEMILQVSMNGLPTIQEQATIMTKSVSQGMNGLGNIFTNVFNQLLEGSKITFGEIVKSIGKMIVKLLVATAAAAALRTILGDASAVASGAKAATGISALLANMAGSFGGFRADGGPVSSGKSYIVGERGPELFTPNVSGGITPNHMLGGGAAGRMQIELVGSANLKMNADGSLAAMLRKDNIRLKKLGG